MKVALLLRKEHLYKSATQRLLHSSNADGVIIIKLQNQNYQ